MQHRIFSTLGDLFYPLDLLGSSDLQRQFNLTGWYPSPEVETQGNLRAVMRKHQAGLSTMSLCGRFSLKTFWETKVDPSIPFIFSKESSWKKMKEVYLSDGFVWFCWGLKCFSWSLCGCCRAGKVAANHSRLILKKSTGKRYEMSFPFDRKAFERFWATYFNQ